MTGQFKSRNGALYTVEIGTDEGTLVMASDPVHLTWEKGETLFVGVKTLSASIRVLATGRELISLYANGPLDKKVIIRKDGVVCFLGYLVPEVWSVSDDNSKNEIELSAVDAVAAMKSVKYTAVDPNNQQPLTVLSIVNRFAQIAGISSIESVNISNVDRVNESYLLSRYGDDDSDDDKKSWTDILGGLATMYCHQYVLKGDMLRCINIRQVISDYPPQAGLGTGGFTYADKGFKMSLDKAYSYVKVCYDNFELPEDLAPEICLERSGGSTGSDLHYEISEASSHDGTVTTYIDSFDFRPTDSRTTCLAMVSCVNNYNSQNPNQYWEEGFDSAHCIIGPCEIKPNRRRCLMGIKRINVSFNLYVNTEEQTLLGNKIASVYSFENNIDYSACGLKFKVGSSEFTFPVNNGRGYVEPERAVGFHKFDQKIDLNGNCDGCFNIIVPENCVIADLKVEAVDIVKKEGEVKLTGFSLKKKDSKISTGSESNSLGTIEISPMFVGGTGYCLNEVDSTIVSQYPYCNVAQWSKPRLRLRRKVFFTQSYLLSLQDIITVDSYPGKRFWPDGGDMDLRNGTIEFELLETYAQGN